jgi:hypothetical protein
VKNANCNLTVYLDDITISGDNIPKELTWQIEKQLYQFNLKSNKKKKRSYINSKSCKITGVIIVRGGALKAPHSQHFKFYKVRRALRLESDPEKRKKMLARSRGLETQIQQVERGSNS